MTVRIHFDLKDLVAAGAVTEKTPNKPFWQIRLPGDEGLIISFPDDDDPFLELSGELLHIEIPRRLDPALIKRLTTHINVYTAGRHVGEYQFKSASGVVGLHTAKEYSYWVKYTAKKLEDLQMLHRLFCGGLIWPVMDYGAEMVLPPCRHLRQLMREAWAIIRRDMTLRRYRA
ncbi:MAG: hypothetical protein Q8R36_03140 [bacterium]|nr:hypothetical protein [bacterium]